MIDDQQQQKYPLIYKKSRMWSEGGQDFTPVKCKCRSLIITVAKQNALRKYPSEYSSNSKYQSIALGDIDTKKFDEYVLRTPDECKKKILIHPKNSNNSSTIDIKFRSAEKAKAKMAMWYSNDQG